jgi:hypothetical protein
MPFLRPWAELNDACCSAHPWVARPSFQTSRGGAGRRAGFIMSDMRQGIEHVQGTQDDAPLVSAIDG